MDPASISLEEHLAPAKAYLDPFVVGFDNAKQGAIIGVNALPGKNTLEVWWYKKNTPLGAGFTPTNWPSVVKRYALAWPTAPLCCRRARPAPTAPPNTGR